MKIKIKIALSSLFCTYGKVTADQLRQEEDRVKEYFWQPTDAPNILYNMIENLAFYADAADLPYTANQLINFGLNVVRRTGQYKRALIEWYAKQDVDKTWNNFKLHFTAAQQQLCQVQEYAIPSG